MAETKSLTEGACVSEIACTGTPRIPSNSEASSNGARQLEPGIAPTQTDTAALIGPVDSHSTKYRAWDRIWHVSLKPAWCFWCTHRAGGESVIGKDTD